MYAPMQQIFSFNSPQDHYTADAIIITCYDNRIFNVRKAFVRDHLKLERPDVVEVAGGIKNITQGNDAERALMLEQIRIAMTLHHAKRVILMPHRDCGAYGGSKQFANAEAEYEFHAGEMAKAMEIIKKAFPDIAVEGYLLDFDGVHA